MAGGASTSTAPLGLVAGQGLRRVQPPIAHCNNLSIKREQGKVTGSFIVSRGRVLQVVVLLGLIAS